LIPLRTQVCHPSNCCNDVRMRLATPVFCARCCGDRLSANISCAFYCMSPTEEAFANCEQPGVATPRCRWLRPIATLRKCERSAPCDKQRPTCNVRDQRDTRSKGHGMYPVSTRSMAKRICGVILLGFSSDTSMSPRNCGSYVPMVSQYAIVRNANGSRN
jgi:hypothetical protein